MHRRALVTGGAGFIGSHLVENLLTDGYEVIALDNFFTGAHENLKNAELAARMSGKRAASRSLEIVRHDVCDPFHFDVDEIYHLACPASPVHYQRNPVRTIETAIVGTSNALKCARDANAKIFIASTSEVYGDPQEHPQTEDYWGHTNPIGPRACYDEGKRAAEALAVSYKRQHRVDVRIARIFNTYGPRMHENDGRVVSNFIVQALRGENITIYGDGMQTRSFCYVSDLVSAIRALMAIDEIPKPVVNLGNPTEITMNMLATEVLRLFPGTRSKLVRQKLPVDDPLRRKPDITIAERFLKWKPVVDLTVGLNLTADDFRRRLLVEE
jgi:UDP-glucuronate decarboxylase